MARIPPPPVPQFLRETLKDYPEIVQDIQEVLADAASSSPYFDWAITRLQDTLSAYRSNAYEAFKAVEKAADSQAIYKAKVKYDALVDARRWPSLDELQNYYETYKGVLG